MTYTFERDAELSFGEKILEIEEWHAANPNPADAEIFDRLAWRMARRWPPDEFGAWLWDMHIAPGKVEAEHAARKVIPYMDEVFADDRAGFAAWVTRWLIERGVSRDVCVEAVKVRVSAREEVA